MYSSSQKMCPPVGFAVQTAGRYAGIQVCGMGGADLQDVGDVYPQELLYVIFTREVARRRRSTARPRPGLWRSRASSKLPEPGKQTSRRLLAVRLSRVSRGTVEGNHLLHAHRLLFSRTSKPRIW